MNIERVVAPLTLEEVTQLTALLCEAVSLGASIGYTDATQQAEAIQAYWQQQSRAIEAANLHFFCARVGQQIVGVVGLECCTKPNGRHRGEIVKLIVGHQWRRQGIARKLMVAAVEFAAHLGLKLLVLDTRSDDITVAFYQTLGWTVAGEIPDFAQSTAGDYQATTVMYLHPTAEG